MGFDDVGDVAGGASPAAALAGGSSSTNKTEASAPVFSMAGRGRSPGRDLASDFITAVAT